MTYRNNLWEAREKGRVLIAAHRGMSGGNISCNTIEAFETALNQGADILETDITLGKEGELFIFHPKQEKNHLNLDVHLEEMTNQEISGLQYVNFDNNKTPTHIIPLNTFLEIYKNRCLINLDHAWNCIPQVVEVVKRHKMENQIILKTPSKIKYAEIVETLAPDIMFMPIIKEQDNISEQLCKMKINFIGSELVFATEQAAVAQDEYIARQHNNGRILWVNAILYSYKEQLSGGHTDDISVTGNPDKGWGWLIDKDFDIIQTDWVLPLKQYMESRNDAAKIFRYGNLRKVYQ